MALVFQYGSNMFTREMNRDDRLCGDAISRGLVCTQARHEFDFDVWSRNRRCYAADIRQGRGRTIWGVLYEVPDSLIERETARARGRRALDEIEGEGTNYRRHPIAVRWRNGRPVRSPVITYTVTAPRPTGATSVEYATLILKGLREHDAPNGYMAYVKKRVIRSNPELSGATANL